MLTESMARTICQWTDKLPRDCRAAADEILIAAARAGAHQEDLAELAAEIYARSLPHSDDDPEPGSRTVRSGWRRPSTAPGSSTGDLTPECAAVVTAVLESLSAPAGARGHPDARAALPRRACRKRCAGWRPAPAARAGRAAGQGRGRTSRWPSCGRWTTGRCWRPSGSPRCGSGGPPAAPRPPTAPAATAAPGWTATPPARWPATRRSPRSSPATSTPASWMTWSRCACSSPGTAPAASRSPGPGPARPDARRARPGRHPAKPGADGRPGPAWRPAVRHVPGGDRPAIIGKAADLLSGPGGLA